MNTITRETFEGMNTDSKLNVLFDYLVDSNQRLQILEKRKRFDTAFSGTMGVIGGFIAMIGVKIWNIK